MIEQQHGFMKRKNSMLANTNDEQIFFSFSDREKHAGITLSRSYLSSVYKIYHCAIKNYMAKEMKKRNENTLHFNVSYEEAKQLHQHKGTSSFKGLATGAKSFGEFRIKFHVVTDSHEQMTLALSECK